MAASRWIVVAAGAVLLAGLAGVWLLTRAPADGSAAVDVLRVAERGAPAGGQLPDGVETLSRPVAPIASGSDEPAGDGPGGVPVSAGFSIDWDDLPKGVERADLSGRVVDGFGVPIAEARVAYVPDSVTQESTSMTGRHSTTDLSVMPGQTTGVDGRFDFPAPWGSAGWRTLFPEFMRDPVLVVDAPGMAIQTFAVEAFFGGARDAGDLVLDVLAGRIVLRAIDDQGLPLAGVKLGVNKSKADEELRAHPGLDARRFDITPLYSAVSDEDGWSEVDGLWPGTCQVSLLHSGFSKRNIDEIVIREGETTQLGEVVFGRGHSIAGVVLDEHGTPIEGAEVFVSRADHSTRAYDVKEEDDWETYDIVPVALDSLHDHRGLPTEAAPAVTDENGRFEKSGIKKEESALFVEARGYEPQRRPGVLVGEGDVSIVLQAQATIEVSLVDRATGEPVQGGVLLAHRRTGRTTWRDKNGERVPLEVIAGGPDAPPGDFVVLRAGRVGTDLVVSAPGYAERGYRVLGLQPGQREQRDIHLVREATLAGLVTDDLGEPVEGAKVSLTPPPDLRVKLDGVEVLSGADGRYGFDALTGGDWELTASKQDYLATEALPLHIEPALANADRDLVLHRGGSIHGLLRNPDGSPAIGTTIYHQRSDPPLENSANWTADGTDREGAFAFTGLKPATYRLKIEPGLDLQVAVGPAELVELDLVLRQPPRVSGWVRSGGAPLADARIVSRYHPEPGGQSWAPRPEPSRSDENGRYQIDLTAEGQHVLYAEWAGGGRSAELTLDATWGAVFSHEFVLGQAVLSGRVVDARDGSPATGVKARLVRAGKAITDWRDVAKNGCFEYSRLDAARYVVEARGGVFAVGRSDESSLEDGERRTDVEVALPLGAVIEGRVLGPDGQPAFSRIFLIDPETHDLQKHSAKGGQFRIVGLSPGTYRLIASSNNFDYAYTYGELPAGTELADMIKAEASVTLASAEVREITLQIQ